jgi:hypothetical protein
VGIAAAYQVARRFGSDCPRVERLEAVAVEVVDDASRTVFWVGEDDVG